MSHLRQIYRRIGAAVLLMLVSIIFCESRSAAAETNVSEFVRTTEGNKTAIVFVHGFGSDPRSTWTNSETGAYWPDLIATDHDFDDADIFIYSYNTGLWSALTVDELADQMRAVLDDKRIKNYEHIVFLSHSLGGLITRSYLLKNRDVASHVSMLYFFSTPTAGSQAAAIAKLLFNSAAIEKMTPMTRGSYLADQMRDWLSARFRFPVHCAYETNRTDGFMVVDMVSALSLCTGPADPIEDDHYGVVKPRDKNAIQYLDFRNAYRDQKIQAEAPSPKPDDPRRDEQRPIIWLSNDIGGPIFIRNPKTETTGQVIWTFHFSNIGKSFLASGTYQTFMKLGDNPFERTYGESGDDSLNPMPPNADQFVTVISAPITLAQFESLSKQDRAFSIRASFVYFDLAHEQHATVVCMTKLLAGPITFCPGNSVK